MLPSDFTAHPWSSVLQKTEAEVIAANIMKILKRTGNAWRELSWEEYMKERIADAGTDQAGFNRYLEHEYFHKVFMYTTSEKSARQFSAAWDVK